ncbi:MAG: transketolase, partial [Candidatus Omnitrophota bacterium]
KQLKSAFDVVGTIKDKPVAILAHTIKGKGISFMEGEKGWHGKAPNNDQLAEALAELA